MQTIAYFNGQYIDADKVLIPVHDAGFLLGTTIAEQIRTFNGHPFWLAQHLQRLYRGLTRAAIEPPIGISALADVVQSVIAHNYPLLAPQINRVRGDIGITIFVTPGAYPSYGIASTGPTIGVHAYPLQFHLWANRYTEGQRGILSSYQDVPASCWPVDIKCRSRMHYFLASKEAKSKDSDAIPILTDQESNISETPIANVIGFREAIGFIAPSESKTLPGISLAYVKQLAKRLEIPFTHRDIAPSELLEFDEIILTSTPFAALPLVSVDGRPIGDGSPGTIFRQIMAEWNADVGVNIDQQAQQHAR